MKEIITLHLGQAGCQIGQSTWELFCLEHHIQPDGLIPQKSYNQPHGNIDTFFSETSERKYVPRSVFIDLEPTVIQQIKKGPYKHLYNPSNLIAEKEDASCNFSRGYCTRGKVIIEKVLDRIRHEAEKCPSLEGFILFHSIGGGTGSGFGSLLCQRLSTDYSKRQKLSFTLFPSPELSTACVQPYNAVLATHALLEHLDLVVTLNNQALYSICSRKLGLESPNYHNINMIIAQGVSSITTSIRFNGALNASIDQILTNMIPYPRIHFVSTAYAPLITPEQAFFEKTTITQLTDSVFEADSQMVKINPAHGKYIACTLQYRGDIVPRQVHQSLDNIRHKKSIEFVDWCPTGFKVGINLQAPMTVPGGILAKTIRCCGLLSNTTAIAEVFHQLDHKFDLMYAKRAFVHWYVGQALEEIQLSECREELAALQKDYAQVSTEAETEFPLEE